MVRARRDSEAVPVKVRVAYTVGVDDSYRRAIVHYGGDESRRLATREEVRSWFRMHGETMDDVLRSEHGACCWHDNGV
jgi:hypothetical protein